MKLYAICLVKDEDDIIEQTLAYATRYCDKVFVLDNGSTDRTWELAEKVAAENPKVIPFGRVLAPFSDALRAQVYNELHGELSDEDWWLRLDGDEFLGEDPMPLLQAANNDGAEIIRSWQIQFYFTERDLDMWRRGEDTRDRSIFDRRRYYLINWQEPRLFRNLPRPAWDTTKNVDFPDRLGKIWPRRILNRHYQFRDPIQMEKRLKLRYGNASFAAHVKSTDWHSTIRASRELSYRREGEPWQFKWSGVASYYGKTLTRAAVGKYRGARRRLTRVVRAR